MKMSPAGQTHLENPAGRTRPGTPSIRLRGATRHGVRLIALGTLVSASILTAALPAQAATTAVKDHGELRVTTSPGVANNITVSRSLGNFFVHDAADTVTPGAGCVSADPHQMSCPAAGISRVLVEAGDGAFDPQSISNYIH